MSLIYNYILGYQYGSPYRELTFDEIASLENFDVLKLKELADKYSVNFENFGITKREAESYFEKLSSNSDTFKKEVLNKCNSEFLRICLVCIPSSLLFCLILIKAFPVLEFLIISWLFPMFIFVFYKMFFPAFENWYIEQKRQSFIKIHLGKRNLNAERYINELMYQAFIENRNLNIANRKIR